MVVVMFTLNITTFLCSLGVLADVNFNVALVFLLMVVVMFTPKGDQGWLMSLPCLESQGCHLIPIPISFVFSA